MDNLRCCVENKVTTVENVAAVTQGSDGRLFHLTNGVKSFIIQQAMVSESERLWPKRGEHSRRRIERSARATINCPTRLSGARECKQKRVLSSELVTVLLDKTRFASSDRASRSVP